MQCPWNAIKAWISRRGGLAVAVVALFLLTGATLENPSNAESAAGVAKLRHDPQFVLRAVAWHMGIRLSPEVPAPAILLESRTPLSRWRAAAERQWRLRPSAFVSAFVVEENTIYLIDDLASHEQRRSTIDDVLAHELAHYLQARYRKDGFDSDWSEFEAVAVQRWFRARFVEAAGRGVSQGAKARQALPGLPPRALGAT